MRVRPRFRDVAIIIIIVALLFFNAFALWSWFDCAISLDYCRQEQSLSAEREKLVVDTLEALCSGMRMSEVKHILSGEEFDNREVTIRKDTIIVGGYQLVFSNDALVMVLKI